MNGNIWSKAEGSALNQVHRGVNLSALRERIAHNVNTQIPLLPSIIAEFLATRSIEVAQGTFKSMFAAIAKENGFSQAQAIETIAEFSQHERDNRNAFGIINAVTRAGQKFDNAFWVKADEIGGQLTALGADGWNKLKTRAAGLTEDAMSKIYGTAV
jgi:hypothetical protein